MSDALMTAALQEAYACAPTSVVLLDTVEIRHPDWSEPVRVVNDYADLTARTETGELVTFVRFAFDLVRPEVNVAGRPEITLAVDGASAEIARLLDDVADSANAMTVIIRTYRSDDLSAPAGRNVPGEIRRVQVSESRVELKVGFGDIGNRPFPAELFTPTRFPGLVR